MGKGRRRGWCGGRRRDWKLRWAARNVKRVSPPKAPPPPTRCTTLTTSSSEREEGQELRNRQRMVRERHEREKEELERLKRQHTVKEDLRRSSKRPTEDLNPYYE